ncbi:purine-binding chemotaxis protein CheW [bacterium]|nr:purine-binding chemotaxis protein CheW [bacterium]
MAESTEIKIIEFILGNQVFGIHIFNIASVIELPEVTNLPKTPEFLEGIINIRGSIIPIVDLKKRFLLPEIKLKKKRKALIINFEARDIGLIVDEVKGVMTLDTLEIDTSTDMANMGIDLEYIEGIAKLKDRLIIILKTSKLLSIKETEIVKKI